MAPIGAVLPAAAFFILNCLPGLTADIFGLLLGSVFSDASVFSYVHPDR